MTIFHEFVAPVGTKPGDRTPGFGVEQGVSLVAPFGRHRGAAEGKAFDLSDGFVVAHGTTVSDPAPPRL
jgi:hypothetical protein